MRALPLLALLLALFPTTSRGEPTSCAIRIDPRWLPGAAKGTVAAAWLTALPQSPIQIQPLLATRRRAVAASALQDTEGPGWNHPLASWQVLRFEDGAALGAAMRVLAARPEILAVEPIRTMALAEDKTVGHATSLATVPWNVSRIGAPEALMEITPDSTLIVAVIDTGADLQHPDLRSRLWRNDDPPGNGRSADDLHDQNGDGVVEDWEKDDDDDNGYVDDEFGFDFTDAPGGGGTGDAVERDADPSDDNGHGTHVAGIIAADGMLRGVAPFVRLMPVRAAYNRVFGSGVLETDDAAAAIVYAVDNGARVLNLSWGDREESLLVRAALDYAVAHGVLIVAAAGNDGAEGPHFPSGDARVIGVGASRADGTVAAFSNRGAAAGVEVVAPGEEGPAPLGGILSLVPLALDDDGQRDGYTQRRGTSMAAAHVSGALALVLCRADHPEARRARALLVASARRDTKDDWSSERGHGEVDALAAVRTTEDLVVTVLGPPRPYVQGTLTLVGTILSGSPIQRSLLLRHGESGTIRTVFAEVQGSVVADTLVHMDVSSQPEGDWEYVLSVQSVEGQRRERHGAFRVDTSPAQLDTAWVAAGWRRGEPHWLLSLEADEPVGTRLLEPGSATSFASDAGLSRRVQIEMPAPIAPGTAPWTLQLENEAGLYTQQELDPPEALSAWPEANVLQLLDTSALTLTSVWGESPVGPVIWGSDAFQTPQAVGVEGDRFVEHAAATGVIGWPRGYADVNGDGSADLLLQAPGERVVWVLTRSGAAMPDSATSGLTRGRALGFFQLDDDAPLETLVARQDSLLLYDDHAGHPTHLLYWLTNPNRTGFNEWGPGAAVGDFDADGFPELACGDAEGFVSRFERRPPGGFQLEEQIDTEGTYAYELLSLPEGVLLVGHQRSTEVTGDGFPAALYAFTTFGQGPARTYAFMARENELRAGSAVAVSPATGDAWLALVQDRDLYMARGAAEPRELVLRLGEAGGDSPVLADLDGDGRLELVLPTSGGAALYRLREDRRGPSGLRAESLGRNSLRLSWEAGDAVSFRLWRRQGAGWEDLGTTNATTWIDSLLEPFVDSTYELDGVLSDGAVTRSNTVVAHAQPLPRWLRAEGLGEAALRLHCSNPLRREALQPRQFVVSAHDGTMHPVDQVSLAEAGRAVDLTLDSALPCGVFTVETENLRDDQGGRFPPEAVSIQGHLDCAWQPLYVVEVRAHSDGLGVEVEWSREPDAAADSIAAYDLRWNAVPLPLSRVERLDATHSLLVPSGMVPLDGKGIPFVLRLVAAISAREDGAALESPDREYRIYVDGLGAPHVVAVPNPVRGPSVTFVEAADDTWIRVFDLQGQLVRELRGALGGGLTWDLRNDAGQQVASGVYVYVARDARGSSTGRIAILH